MDCLDQRYLAGLVLVGFLAILSCIVELSKCIPVIKIFQDARAIERKMVANEISKPVKSIGSDS
jgi:hypothetical protein